MPGTRRSITVLLGMTGMMLLPASGEASAQTVSYACGAPGPLDVLKPGAKFPSYLDDSFSQLKTEVPALRGLKFEGTPTPEQAADVMTKAGASITTMLPRVPNLVAREELSQASVPLPYSVQESQPTSSGGPKSRYNISAYNSSSKGVEGDDLRKVLDELLATPGNKTPFSYRIQNTEDPKIGRVLEEYRTNDQNEAVDFRNLGPGNPRGVGFSNAWLMFVPMNQKESRFRYLGRQKIDRHETMAVAFAQTPALVHVPAAIANAHGDCSFYMQGVVWVDAVNAEIVRLQTDLLSPIPGIHLKQLRSEIRFNQVKIKERDLTLSMPSEVEITWETNDHAGAELHRYSNYRLFTATSRLIVPKPD